MHFVQFDTVMMIAMLSLVVESITEIVVDSKIFEPLRAAIFRWSLIDPTKPIPRSAYFKEYIAYFIKCGYCFSVWVSAAVSLFFPVALFQFAWFGNFLDLVVQWACSVFVYHRLANWLHVWFKRSQVGIVDVKDLKVTVEDTRASK
jgi:hypothetical protein